MNQGDPHFVRKQDLLAEHPEIKKLAGHDPRTALYVLAVLACSGSMTGAVQYYDSWTLAILLGFTIGPFIDAAILVAIHELSHNLCTGSIVKDRLLGILVNLPMLFPISEIFRQHHASHHLNLGHGVLDVDTPLPWEIAFVGSSTVRKIFWITFNMVFLPVRSLYKVPVRWNQWVVLNWVTSLGALVLVALWSPKVLVCLLISLFFSQGAHPANARQLQEHLWDGSTAKAVDKTSGQATSTYSYYGWTNALFLNVGYHREHHDYARVPWSRLPELRRIGGEKHYPCSSEFQWRGMGDLLNFFFNKDVSLGNFFNAERGNDRVAAEAAKKVADNASAGIALRRDSLHNRNSFKAQ